MATPRRGLRDIRTMSDLLTETSNPQRKFLKLAMLAMEKVRRSKERKSARQRIEDTDSRLAEVDAESEKLLRLVGATAGDERGAAPKGDEAKPAPRRSQGRFRLRY